MKPSKSLWILVASALPLAACGSSPEQLRSAVQKALDSGNGDALVAKADVAGAPAMLSFMLLDMPSECSGETVCTVSIAPLDAEWEKSNAEQLAGEGVAYATKPEGLLKIAGKPRDPKAASSGSMNASMPYAKVGSDYRLAVPKYTAAKLAELKATTAQAAADKTLASGVYDATTGERDLQWKSKATPLPAGGGEPGAAFLAKVKAMTAAVKANDVDAAAKAGGPWGEAVLGATNYAGPVPIEERRRKLRTQAVRFITEATVLGGYELGDFAVLVIEGRNGVGNDVRGAQFMSRMDGAWSVAGNEVIELPGGA
jgi:hypothetical protein